MWRSYDDCGPALQRESSEKQRRPKRVESFAIFSSVSPVFFNIDFRFDRIFLKQHVCQTLKIVLRGGDENMANDDFVFLFYNFRGYSKLISPLDH